MMRIKLTCIVLSLLISQMACGAITDNLEVYFTLDDGTGTTVADSSGLGRDGLLLNRGGSDQNGPAPGLNGAGPQDPNPGHSPWVPGRFGGAFAPAGAPDADGDVSPQFGTGSFFAGQPYWMLVRT